MREGVSDLYMNEELTTGCTAVKRECQGFIFSENRKNLS